MRANKKIFAIWASGAAVLVVFFYASVAWLWSAARSSAVSSLEKQVGAVLANDLAEGNVFRLGASLSRLKAEGHLDYAEIRAFNGTGWERLFRTAGVYGDLSPVFEGFSCTSGRKPARHPSAAVSVVTALPARIEGAECVALFLSSDLPEDLKNFKNRLLAFSSSLMMIFLAFFLRMVFVWHKETMGLELAVRTAAVEKEAAVGRLAAQVAHDIRSPLAALLVAMKGLRGSPEQKELIEAAAGRMSGIAEDLLLRYRVGGHVEAESSIEELAALIRPVIVEKSAQYGDRSGLKLEFIAPVRVYAAVEASEFQRVVSNLINNAAEAIGGPGSILIMVREEDGGVVTEIRDSGKGIVPELISKLGRSGATSGKVNGCGLGLFHARTTAERWGGSIEIESEPGKGTIVRLKLPSRKPSDATPTKASAGKRTAVLLDDDHLVHMNWRIAARRAGIELVSCKTVEELRGVLKRVSADTPFYIDSELGAGVKGEDISAELSARGFTDVTLETEKADSCHPGLGVKVRGKEPPWG